MLLLALVTVSCGGNVAVEPAGGATSSNSSSASSSGVTTGTGATCPAFPAIGDKCAVPGQACPVPFGCCGEGAVCTGGVWVYQQPTCHHVCIPCVGGLSCDPGSICVAYERDSAVSAECRQDPCPGTTDCACVQSLCAEVHLQCASHDMSNVVCDCPSC